MVMNYDELSTKMQLSKSFNGHVIGDTLIASVYLFFLFSIMEQHGTTSIGTSLPGWFDPEPRLAIPAWPIASAVCQSFSEPEQVGEKWWKVVKSRWQMVKKVRRLWCFLAVSWPYYAILYMAIEMKKCKHSPAKSPHWWCKKCSSFTALWSPAAFSALTHWGKKIERSMKEQKTVTQQNQSGLNSTLIHQK